MPESLVPLYFGHISYWIAILKENPVLVDPALTFQKASRLNRMEIMTANGIDLLTIPVEGGRNSKTTYTDIRISYHESWSNKHWHALRSAYGKSAYWEFYNDALQSFYNKRFEFLIDLNVESLNIVAKILKTKIPYIHSAEDMDLKTLRPLLYHKRDDFPVYFQTFSHKQPFASDLSILDLVLNLGPRSTDYLRSKISP